jgi:hypothetical protein
MTFEFLSYCIYPLTHIEYGFVQAAGGKAEEQESDQNPYCHPGETDFIFLILKGHCHEMVIFSKSN